LTVLLVVGAWSHSAVKRSNEEQAFNVRPNSTLIFITTTDKLVFLVNGQAIMSIQPVVMVAKAPVACCRCLEPLNSQPTSGQVNASPTSTLIFINISGQTELTGRNQWPVL